MNSLGELLAVGSGRGRGTLPMLAATREGDEETPNLARACCSKVHKNK